MRRIILLVSVLLGTLSFGGCPGTGGAGETPAPSGDPIQGGGGTPLVISATATLLQFNASSLTKPQFPRTALLSAIVTPSSVQWTIAVVPDASPATPDISVLAFSTGGQTTTASSTSAVTVTATAAPDATVRHQVTAVATFDDGSSVSQSIFIDVAPDPVVGGESTVLTLNPLTFPATGVDANSQVVLSAGVTGAVGAVEFDWSPVDPSNLPPEIDLPALLDEESITLTVTGPVSGVFPFRVTASDSVGTIATAVVNVFLGVTNIQLDVRALDVLAAPTGSVSLQTLRTGGLPDLDTSTNGVFRYTWQVLDSAGTDVTAFTTISPPSGSFADATANSWTISGLVTDTYTFIATVADARGGLAVAHTTVLFGPDLGLTAAPSASSVGLNTAFDIRTVRSGGGAPFTYSVQVLDQNGVDVTGSTTISPPSGTVRNDVTNDWAVTGIATAGVYRFVFTVTDGGGASFAAATEVSVGGPLGVDAKLGSNVLSPGGVTPMTFDISGGVPPYTVQFINAGGSGGGTPSYSLGGNCNAGCAVQANGDVTFNYAAPAGSTSFGTYRTDVSVTDSLGAVTTDHVWALVAPTDPNAFVVDVQAAFTQITPPTALLVFNGLLRTVRIGGVANFNYVWTVVNEAGAVVPGFTFTPQVATTNQTIDWNVGVPSVPQGTYRFQATVFDNGSLIAVGSAEILLRAPDLSLAISSPANVLAGGVPVQLTATAAGGSGTYNSFTFIATDAQNNAGVGAFSAVSIVGANGSVVFVPPLSGSGTYRIDCTVQDSLGNLATTEYNVYVDSWLASGDQIINPPASQTDLSSVVGVFEAGEDFGQGGSSPYIFVPDTVAPVIGKARSITYRIVDGGAAGVDVSAVRVIGQNDRGEIVVDTFDPVEANFGTTVTDRTIPFRSIVSVVVTFTNGSNGDTIEIGIGDWFGLSAPFPTQSEAFAEQSFAVVAVGADLAGSPQNVTAFLDPENNVQFQTAMGFNNHPDQQSVRFPANAPNGTTDYILQHSPFNQIQLEVSSDDYELDSSNGEVASLIFKVKGGTPPYSYTYQDISPTANFGVFGLAGAQPNLFGSALDDYTAPAGVTANEVHTIKVYVSDSSNRIAAGEAQILIVP